ncbi:glucose 1-dehydrogenase [Criblamydia sequanensis]|uniref:Short-chain dehydrogenase/reductase n=1 Tax=Candidatus Criblamydia sequanensis CRIB-18 TaxID=1437425 RepID=A0A090DZA8_9BACT|nr:glucose 1-dehydrogenase [Criblamydia sequanensis]CDR34014.1 Short-chain dehydrogenase/reductase [Criblamydia sequanensis CRIB-18]
MFQERLKDQVALITGATQGIGAEIATAFSREGATVVITDVNDSKGVSFAKEIGKNCLYLHLDVKEESEWQQVMATVVEKFGKLNILVNNAGITGFQEGFGPQDPENASLDSWRKVHAVNMDGIFLGCKYGIQVIKNTEKGSIINISSRSGLIGIPEAAAYASSKAAVRNHTKTVALYCCQQGYNIRCNSVHPAVILTPMWEPMLGSGPEREVRMAEIAKDIPMQKVGMPIDVANAVLFLASDESKYITGIELSIDGGMLAGICNTPKRNDV